MKSATVLMLIRVISATSVVIVTGINCLIGVSYANDDRGVRTKPSAVFDNSRSFVPPNQLPFASPQYRTLRTDAQIARQLQTISVTPDGTVRTLNARRVDVEIFKQALRRVNSSTAIRFEQPEGGLAVSGEFSTGRQVLDRSLIGRDTRRQVSRTTGYPYRAIGHLGNGCTGTLVGPRHVLTAGHCVYNITSNRWYSRLNFAPGRSGTTRPFGGHHWERALSTRGWVENKRRGSDYAMVILRRDLGRRVGWMAFGWNPRLPRHTVNIIGYPGDKRPRHTMWASSCRLQRILTSRLYYSCDTSSGMSGSPVYVFWPSTRRRIVYGIHAYGLDSTGMNSATRIDQSVFNQVRRWKAKY